MKNFRFIPTLLLFVISSTLARAGDAPASPQKAGQEILGKIQSSFYMPQSGLYAEQIQTGKKLSPSWTWDASIQLQALCTAARLDPKTYLPQVRIYATALRSYRTTNHNLPGFDVNPGPKSPDRYYDDNAWICLALLETYELTHDQRDLAFATDAYKFALSGEDSTTLGGGIYWHEDNTKSKNACSSGPVMLAALAFHKITGDKKYLDTVQRLYAWTCDHLQDKDGLVYDSISVPDGKINRAKLTYNCGTLLRANCGLYRITGDKHYLEEAERIARAAEKRFIHGDTLEGPGKLAVKLIEAWLDLYDTDHDDHWRELVGRCLTDLHGRRNEQGWYPMAWDAAAPEKTTPYRLIDQSAPARAFWLGAAHKVEVN